MLDRETIKNSSHDTLLVVLLAQKEISELKEKIKSMTIELEDLRADAYSLKAEKMIMEAFHGR